MAPKSKLGQNFLVDDGARHAIADALGTVDDRTVVEIGPGHGAITSILATRCRQLIAIEVDPSLVMELRFVFREQAQVEIVETDVLKADVGGFASAGETVDVVGNLPYYITSDILLHLFAAARAGKVRRAVLMMQREVADRLIAEPGVRDFGLLSVTTQLHARVERILTLPPSAFSPPPEVYSTVLRLEFAPRFDELGVDAAHFDRFLKQTFAQKRKTLSNNLRAAGYNSDEVRAAWPAEIPEAARAEAVSIEALAKLHRELEKRRANG